MRRMAVTAVEDLLVVTETSTAWAHLRALLANCMTMPSALGERGPAA